MADNDDSDDQLAGSSLPPQTRGRHRRVRSGQSGEHSRSESLFGSLADVMEVLTVIDEVEVDPVGTYLPVVDENEAAPTTEVTEAEESAHAPTVVAAARTHRRNHTVGGNHDVVTSPDFQTRGRHLRGASMTEGLLEEVLDIKNAFVEELNVADEGNTFFLDMTLARGMSMLPEDMVRVAEATAPEHLLETDEGKPEEIIDPEKMSLVEGKPVETAASVTPLSAYVLLATAIVALSSIGPLLNLQTGINPILKIYWRMSATAMVLSPLAAISVYNEGLPKTLDNTKKITLLVTAACYATMCVGFVLALQYTAVGNAVILANSQSVLLLFGKLFVGQRILYLEAAGAIFAFGGAALCSLDSAESEGGEGDGDATGSATSNGHMTLFGDFLALVSATGGVFYLTFAKTVRPHISLYLFMFLIMFFGSTMLLIFLFVFTNIEMTVDRNVTTGIWGWMNLESDRLPLELTMVILCNLFGAMGYIRAMQYFDNLVIAVAALLEPAVAALLAAAVGVANLPGAMGWIGNALVFAGTFAVVYPSASSGKGGGGH